jgi:hypothetical protein
MRGLCISGIVCLVGKAGLYNEMQTGHPSVITKDVKDMFDAHIHENG